MPKVAIIGRQNVGKSTLFNALLGQRKSIVIDCPGVTRDMVSKPAPWSEGSLTLTDFPGFEGKKGIQDELTGQAITRAIERLQDQDLILWVVDRRGLTPFEKELVNILRELGQPTWLLVNFVDDPKLESEASDMYSLGIETLYMISALNRRGISDLRNALLKHFELKKSSGERKDDDILNLALVGKPNAGKSTLFNWLLNKDLALVSEVPGTTRDSLEEVFEFEDQKVRLIDTAGLRRKKTSHGLEERFSVMRTREALEAADVTWILVDPHEGFDSQNRHIISLAEELNKTIVVTINKSDRLEADSPERKELELDLDDMKKIFWKFPVFFISAINGKRVTTVLQKIISLHTLAGKKQSTSFLNIILEKIANNPQVARSRIRMRYITRQYPHKTFLLFTAKKVMPENIFRYLKNELRRQLGWDELPLRIDIRRKEPRDRDKINRP